MEALHLIFFFFSLPSHSDVCSLCKINEAAGDEDLDMLQLSEAELKEVTGLGRRSWARFAALGDRRLFDLTGGRRDQAKYPVVLHRAELFCAVVHHPLLARWGDVIFIYLFIYYKYTAYVYIWPIYRHFLRIY